MATKSRRSERTRDFYKSAVKMLRSVAEGFDSDAGYSLRDIDEWTPAQKSKVTRYFHEVNALTARPYIIKRFRNEKHLKAAQRFSQHDKGFSQFKVAFVPTTTNKPVKIRFTKRESMVTEGPYFEKIEIEFDQKRLARDPNKEIQRAITAELGEKPKNYRFIVQAGKYLMRQVATDVGAVQLQVRALMNRYDGKKQLGRGRAWNPKHHKYSQWLHGVTAYHFEGGGNARQLIRDINAAKKQRAKMFKAERAKRYRAKKKGD